jgi:hypothetical protein
MLTGKYCWKELNRDTKTVVVADGSGNQDKQAIANESWVAGNVLFSKTGQGEKAKPGEAMPNLPRRRIPPSESPHNSQVSRLLMFISRSGCAKLLPRQRQHGFQRAQQCTVLIFRA